MLNAQFFTDTGQHREKMKTLAVYFIIKHINNCWYYAMVWVVIKQVKLRVNSLQMNFKNVLKKKTFIEIHQAESWLRSNIKDINFQLYNYAQEHPAYNGMGTTLVCAIVYDKR